MTVKYRTGGIGVEGIDAVELVRETPKMVVIREPHYNDRSRLIESRYLKGSSYCQLHDTWEDAHKHLIKVATLAVAETALKMATLEQKLVDIKRMKPARLQ